ncbi:uncharacterized protein VTP21DRAFT_1892 [Calcarisporiella thermophila]|uniref:uncharacterized protein n=1 Tax=Calcarisporiella thermophila TaxID=911321 RepID=UPI003742BE4A
MKLRYITQPRPRRPTRKDQIGLVCALIALTLLLIGVLSSIRPGITGVYYLKVEGLNTLATFGPLGYCLRVNETIRCEQSIYMGFYPLDVPGILNGTVPELFRNPRNVTTSENTSSSYDSGVFAAHIIALIGVIATLTLLFLRILGFSDRFHLRGFTAILGLCGCVLALALGALEYINERDNLNAIYPNITATTGPAFITTGMAMLSILIAAIALLRGCNDVPIGAEF